MTDGHVYKPTADIKPSGYFSELYGYHSGKGLFHTCRMSKITDERKAFSERLKIALKRSPRRVETAADLAVQFSLRHQGEQITAQAAKKWLSGEAQPTVDKLETLAEWLTVSLQWLRYGIPEERSQATGAPKSQKTKQVATVSPTDEELKVLTRLRNLPEHQRILVTEIIEQFSLDREMWTR